jgi:hypothetical protein
LVVDEAVLGVGEGLEMIVPPISVTTVLVTPLRCREKRIDETELRADPRAVFISVKRA